MKNTPSVGCTSTRSALLNSSYTLTVHVVSRKITVIGLWLQWNRGGDPDALGLYVSYDPEMLGPPRPYGSTAGGRPADCWFDDGDGYSSCRIREGDHSIFIGGNALTPRTSSESWPA